MAWPSLTASCRTSLVGQVWESTMGVQLGVYKDKIWHLVILGPLSQLSQQQEGLVFSSSSVTATSIYTHAYRQRKPTQTWQVAPITHPPLIWQFMNWPPRIPSSSPEGETRCSGPGAEQKKKPGKLQDHLSLCKYQRTEAISVATFQNLF